MNKAAVTKHEIYNKLGEFSSQDLDTVIHFIDFLRYKKQVKEKKLIKLEGILKDKNIDLSDLKEFKLNSWKHLEAKFENK